MEPAVRAMSPAFILTMLSYARLDVNYCILDSTELMSERPLNE